MLGAFDIYFYFFLIFMFEGVFKCYAVFIVYICVNNNNIQITF